MIDFDEVLAELEGVFKENPAGFTVREMEAATGRASTWCNDKIRKLMAAGKLRFAGRRRATRVDGVTCWVPVYQLVKK